MFIDKIYTEFFNCIKSFILTENYEKLLFDITSWERNFHLYVGDIENKYSRKKLIMSTGVGYLSNDYNLLSIMLDVRGGIVHQEFVSSVESSYSERYKTYISTISKLSYDMLEILLKFRFDSFEYSVFHEIIFYRDISSGSCYILYRGYQLSYGTPDIVYTGASSIEEV